MRNVQQTSIYLIQRFNDVSKRESSNYISIENKVSFIQTNLFELFSMENVQDNMEHAYEHAPEFFGNVVMLYIVRNR